MNSAPTILVVEDEPSLCESVRAWLTEAGFTVLTARDGDEALALLSTYVRIDALLTTIRIPGAVDGWSLAEKARALNPWVAVVYASAHGAQRFREVERSFFLHKPYFQTMLLEALTLTGVKLPG